jgi:hypothetical protein
VPTVTGLVVIGTKVPAYFLPIVLPADFLPTSQILLASPNKVLKSTHHTPFPHCSPPAAAAAFAALLRLPLPLPAAAVKQR